MKIIKKKVQFRSTFVNSIINLDRPPEKILKWKVYIEFKWNNTPNNNDSGSYEINLTYYGEGSPEEWVVYKFILIQAHNGQSNMIGP